MKVRISIYHVRQHGAHAIVIDEFVTSISVYTVPAGGAVGVGVSQLSFSYRLFPAARYLLQHVYDMDGLKLTGPDSTSLGTTTTSTTATATATASSSRSTIGSSSSSSNESSPKEESSCTSSSSNTGRVPGSHEMNAECSELSGLTVAATSGPALTAVIEGSGNSGRGICSPMTAQVARLGAPAVAALSVLSSGGTGMAAAAASGAGCARCPTDSAGAAAPSADGDAAVKGDGGRDTGGTSLVAAGGGAGGAAGTLGEFSGGSGSDESSNFVIEGAALSTTSAAVIPAAGAVPPPPPVTAAAAAGATLARAPIADGATVAAAAASLAAATASTPSTSEQVGGQFLCLAPAAFSSPALQPETEGSSDTVGGCAADAAAAGGVTANGGWGEEVGNVIENDPLAAFLVSALTSEPARSPCCFHAAAAGAVGPTSSSWVPGSSSACGSSRVATCGVVDISSSAVSTATAVVPRGFLAADAGAGAFGAAAVGAAVSPPMLLTSLGAEVSSSFPMVRNLFGGAVAAELAGLPLVTVPAEGPQSDASVRDEATDSSAQGPSADVEVAAWDVGGGGGTHGLVVAAASCAVSAVAAPVAAVAGGVAAPAGAKPVAEAVIEAAGWEAASCDSDVKGQSPAGAPDPAAVVMDPPRAVAGATPAVAGATPALAGPRSTPAAAAVAGPSGTEIVAAAVRAAGTAAAALPEAAVECPGSWASAVWCGDWPLVVVVHDEQGSGKINDFELQLLEEIMQVSERGGPWRKGQGKEVLQIHSGSVNSRWL